MKADNGLSKAAIDMMITAERDAALLTAPHLLGVYRVISEMKCEIMGTGLYIRHREGHFILTSAHVLAGNGNIAVFGGDMDEGHGEEVIALRAGPFFADYPGDVASAVLPPDAPSLIQGRRPVSPAALAITTDDHHYDCYFVNGYLESRSRLSCILGDGGPSILPFATIRVSIIEPQVEYFNPAMHFVLGCPAYADWGERKQAGGPVGLAGLSGAPVWGLRMTSDVRPWKLAKAEVVGIVNAWDEDGQCFVATKIEAVRRHMELWL